MELLFPHECHNCGLVDEARFTYAGPHIKQVCNGCACYVKFVSKGIIPDTKEIKLKVWAISTDLEKIDLCKGLIGFVPNLVGVDEKLMYWRLYLKMREEFNA